jgi:hypothetical protein
MLLFVIRPLHTFAKCPPPLWFSCKVHHRHLTFFHPGTALRGGGGQEERERMVEGGGGSVPESMVEPGGEVEEAIRRRAGEGGRGQ